jgi:hypothetical protein
MRVQERKPNKIKPGKGDTDKDVNVSDERMVVKYMADTADDDRWRVVEIRGFAQG